jgi:putative ABC transport system permease protein
VSGFSLIPLALRSLMSRKAAVLLSVFAVALSVTLFLGVDKIRRGANAGFESTITGTDLIVGARSGPVNLLLYSVFRIGDPTTSISWESYEDLSSRRGVKWTIPLSMGDSHENFRVVGTTRSYLDHYRYGDARPLTVERGKWFEDEHDAVLGAAVAADLGYELGDEFPISHGLISAGFSEHKGHMFRVSGILARTGTPVDRTIHVSLAGLDAVHETGAEDHEGHEEHEPEAISAFLVGLENRSAVLVFQRMVNTYKPEPLTAVIPGIALTQLWSVVGTAQTALAATAGFVVVTGLLSLLIASRASLNARARELAVLRAAGAGPSHIFSLVILETALIATFGTLIGAGIVFGGMEILGPILSTQYGIPLGTLGISGFDLAILAGVIGLATLLGIVPATQAYRRSLADGLTMKL